MSADAITQFRDALAQAGLPAPEHIAADGALHRFATNGRASDDSGWYVLHLEGIAAGAFGDWRSGISETWRADIGRALTPQEERSHRERMEQARRERERAETERAREAAERAAEMWRTAQPAPTDHPYLTRKGVQSHGLRVHCDSLVIGGIECDGALMLPLCDTSGTLHSLEFITAGGEKRYLPGGRITRCYFSIGQPNGVLCIAEGFSTVASVHAATGHAVACATSAGNLLPVAKGLREKFPAASIVIAADDDYRTDGNPGLTKAREAAAAIGASLAVPVFGEAREDDATDFNDMARMRGLDAVREVFDAVLASPIADAAPAVDAPSNDSGHEQDATASRIAELAKLSPIQYDRLRKTEAKALGVQLKTLDAAVTALRVDADDTEKLTFDDPEPWPGEVDGAALVEQIRSEVRRYVVLPEHAATAIALWAVHTWSHEASFISPFLFLRSPEKRCGKSTLMLILSELVRRSLLATNASPAALFRCIEEYRPTLLLDEADTWMRENEELRGILNGGHSRKTAQVLRTVGEQHEVRVFSTFCPKAISGIGRLVDTLEDRSIIIHMMRKRPEDTVSRLRQDRLDFNHIRRKCQRWTEDHSEELNDADPETPGALNDRAADNWRALLAIADAAGGKWPKEARAAALSLSGQSDDEAIGAQLLADIRGLFERNGEHPIPSASLVDELGKMEERPWPEWKQGRPITASQVARLLKPFEIRPRTVRLGYETAKGYLPEQFCDAFARYLPATPQSVTPSQPHQYGSEIDAASRHTENTASRHTVTSGEKCDGVTDQQKNAVTAEDEPKAYKNRDCDGVTVRDTRAATEISADDSEAF